MTITVTRTVTIDGKATTATASADFPEQFESIILGNELDEEEIITRRATRRARALFESLDAQSAPRTISSRDGTATAVIP